MCSTAKEQLEARCKFMLIQVFLFIACLSLWLTGPKDIIWDEPFTTTEQVTFGATQLSTPSVTDQNLDKQCKLQMGVWKIQIIIYIYIYPISFNAENGRSVAYSKSMRASTFSREAWYGQRNLT